MTTPWSKLDPNFLREGPWSNGQGIDAPDRVMLRDRLEQIAPCTLLDVGCGTAITLDGIVNEELEVTYTGLDFTPEFIAACIKRHPGTTFLEGDLYNLGRFPQFDVVTARGVLEHVADPETALQILYRCCKKLLFVAFFIAPGELEQEITEDGFIQQRCDFKALHAAVEEFTPSREVRHTYEHAGQDWSVWELWR